MPFGIPKSHIVNSDTFEIAVKEYIAQLTAFNFQKGKPKPAAAHPYIENAVKRIQAKGRPDVYVPDYEIFDDGPAGNVSPSDEVTFQMKKEQLFQAMTAAEAAAKDKVLPRGKHRLVHLQVMTVQRKPDETRNDEDMAKLKYYEDIVSKFEALDLIAAHGFAAIEDLTPDTIDSWQLPTFE